MLDLIPEHLRLFVVIGGLLLTLLLMASLSQKYEQYIATKRRAANQIMVVAHQIEAALDKTQGVGLPPGIGKLLRNEMLARYITIRQIFPRQPQLNQLIQQAQERARAESDGSDTINGTAITSIALLNRYIVGVSEVIELFNNQLLGRSISAVDRKTHQLKLLDFQLMAAHRFYTRIATDSAQKGEWEQGMKSVRALESFLFSRPKATPLSGQIRIETRALVLAMNDHRLPGQDAPSTAIGLPA